MRLQQSAAIFFSFSLSSLGVHASEGCNGAVLVDKLCPLHQGAYHLVFGHYGYILAFHEKVASLVAGGYSQVGVAGFAGAVHHAAHHSHLQRDFAVAESIHGPVSHLKHIYLGSSATRAGDEVDILALAQAHGFQKLTTGSGFFHWIGCEGIADGVADAVGQQGGYAGGGFHYPGGRRAGFGYAQVQGQVGNG